MLEVGDIVRIAKTNEITTIEEILTNGLGDLYGNDKFGFYYEGELIKQESHFKIGDSVKVSKNVWENQNSYVGKEFIVKDVEFGYTEQEYLYSEDESLYFLESELIINSVADKIYNHINGGNKEMENNNLMNVIAPSFEELRDKLDHNMVYNAGHMLNKANATQRVKEAEDIRDLGYSVWNPIEDKSINSKNGLDKATNDNLSKRIVRNDVTGILRSKNIVIEPEVFALGSITELGMIFAYKHVAAMLNEIFEKNYCPEDFCNDMRELVEMLDKNVYCHLDDIRAENGIEEVNYNRSWGVNQFVRGTAQALTNTEDGFMSFDKIINELKGEK